MSLFFRRSPGAASVPVEQLHRAYISLGELARLRFQARSLKLRPDRRALRQTAGAHLSRFRGRGIDFAEVRQYQPGDDIRTIDWRVTARRGNPHTKLFQEERERPVLLLVDQSLSQFFGSRLAFKSVRAAELASLLAWATVQRGDRVGGLVFSDFGHHELRPGRSQKDVSRFLKLLHAFNRQLSLEKLGQPVSFDLNQALAETRRIAKPGSLIFVISDFQDQNDETRRHLHLLARHNDLIAFCTYDPLEASLPASGVYGVSDGQHSLRIDAGDSRLRQAFSGSYENNLKQLKDTLAKASIPLIQASTQDSALDVLRRTFTSASMP